MNTARLLQLASHIEAHPELFDMTCFANINMGCQTVGCIAGNACWLFEPDKAQDLIDRSKPRSYDFPEIACDALGLTRDQSDDLFYAWAFPRWSAITPSMAAQAIRNLAATGSPHWESFP